MKLLIINGPNLNMLGIREPELYGPNSYESLADFVGALCKSYKMDCEIFQSNHEGEIIDKIQDAYKKADGIIINAGAYTHTSLAIADALRAVGIPVAEVHLTDISKREEYRRFSYIAEVASARFMGEGFVSYKKAVEFFAARSVNQ